CMGTSTRQKAKSITQLEIMPKPPAIRSACTPWPQWPYKLSTSSSHKEGGERLFSTQTIEFIGENGKLSGVKVQDVTWQNSPNGRPQNFTVVPNSIRTIPADLALLALGFVGVIADNIAKELNININDNGRLSPAPNNGIFIVGDAYMGQSLVVKTMRHAKEIAQELNNFLMEK
ncbi:MAG: glutamate synthase, partial [Lentisphaeria bacterium]